MLETFIYYTNLPWNAA